MTRRNGTVPLDTESDQISWKLLKSPPHIYSSFLCQVASDCMQVVTVHCGPPINRKCRNISKTTEIPDLKPDIFLFLVSSSRWWYVGHDHTKWSNRQEMPYYLENSWDPHPYMTGGYQAVNSLANCIKLCVNAAKKINAYRRRKSFSIGQDDSGERCGPWASLYFKCWKKTADDIICFLASKRFVEHTP
jgi:hypothetical protein